MDEFTINEMKEMQLILQEKYKDKWEGISVLAGRNKLLWMIGEIPSHLSLYRSEEHTSELQSH